MSLTDRQTESFVALRENNPSIENEDWSESDTRSKIIDQTLIDCLGWSESEIVRELSKDQFRLDYRLSLSRPIVVVEAKKSRLEFKTRQGEPEPYRIKLSTLLRGNPGMKEPIAQVVAYCREWSTPLAVLTNGKTYVIFLGNRIDGTPYEDGNALILSDIFHPRFNFSDLQNVLSKDAVSAGRTENAILDRDELQLPESIISTYTDPDAGITPNPLGIQIEPLLREVFTDVTKEDSKEVLEHCYIPPSESPPRDAAFEAMLIDTPPNYARAVQNVVSANAYRKFEEQLSGYLKPQEDLKEAMAKRQWSQTMIVIGGVGVGKTFFLLRHFSSSKHGAGPHQNSVAFYIDLRRPDVDPEKVPELIYRRLRAQLMEMDGGEIPDEAGKTYDFSSADGLEQVFRGDMRQFEKLAKELKQSDPVEYDKAKLQRLLELSNNDRNFVIGAFSVLRHRYHRRVCIIIDNVDQCQPPYQHAVYLFARTMESELACLIVVALREEWYWHHAIRAGGPMSAYHDVVYHIPAAPVRDVLARRLEYAIELLETRMPVAEFSIGNIVVLAEHVVRYLRIIRRAILEDEPITLFFESMANGNIREGLDRFLDFVRSGHTRAEEYLVAITQKDDYKLRFHQVFKSIAYGSFRNYRSSRSKVPNVVSPLFSLAGNWHSYFARVYLLGWLLSKSKLDTPAGHGFVPIDQAREFLRRLGLTESLQSELISGVVGASLVEPEVRLEKSPETWRFIRIMTKGVALIRRLPSRFAYWEAIMLDTPIMDPETHARISGMRGEGKKLTLVQRLECVRMFLKFLTEIERLEQAHIRQAGLAASCPPFMSFVEEALKLDLARLDAMATTAEANNHAESV